MGSISGVTRLLLSPEEVGETIGVGRSTVFKLLASGEIPSIRVGRLRKIPSAWLEAWIERHGREQASGVEEGL